MVVICYIEPQFLKIIPCGKERGGGIMEKVDKDHLSMQLDIESKRFFFDVKENHKGKYEFDRLVKKMQREEANADPEELKKELDSI